VIPHITKGSDVGGLLRYLAGPGRANEHENPHVIGGDGFLQAWHGQEELGLQDASEIAAYLDEPRQTYGVQMMAKEWRQNPENGAREAVLDANGEQAWKDVNVWHCSLSLPPGEVLSAERWEQVSREFADGMNLTDAGGRAPVRWVAIHHGASKGGNDHVHIAASMVREDGTRWEGRFKDWPRAQAVCRDLEQKHGLTPVDGRQHGTAVKGARPAELNAAERAGAPIIAREDIAHRVRAAAVASTSEAEWVRRVRASGVVVKPRFAAGTTDVVAGYRAALRTDGAARLNFYSGGQLGSDLSLPRLREMWPAPSIEQADQASAEWQAAFRSKRPAAAGREATDLAPAAPEVARRNLQAFSEQLGRTPVGDRAAWSRAARDVSGALSAWAQADPQNAAELRATASVVARAAQDRRAGGQRGQRTKESPMGLALVLLASNGAAKPGVAATALMAQILRAASAISDYHRATNNVRQAQALETQLARLGNLSVTIEPVRTAGPGLQLPTPLAARPHTGARVTTERGSRDAGR
jgi:hypothetical protein